MSYIKKLAGTKCPECGLPKIMTHYKDMNIDDITTVCENPECTRCEDGVSILSTFSYSVGKENAARERFYEDRDWKD
jgi:ribosomal protein S27AE